MAVPPSDGSPSLLDSQPPKRNGFEMATGLINSRTESVKKPASLPFARTVRLRSVAEEARAEDEGSMTTTTPVSVRTEVSADAATSPGAQSPAPSASPLPKLGANSRWGIGKRVAFRFAFAYFALFLFPSPLGIIPGLSKPAAAYENLQTAAVVWVAKHLLRLNQNIPTATNGSGDRLADYLHILCFVALATIVALVWSIVDRKRPNYDRLFAFLRIWVRYYLACTMMSYGMSKVFRLQFPPNGVWRLTERYGDSSPMGILWAFMGASGPYTIFGGLAELIPGILLFFRRTTTLGALVLVPVLTNIVLMNLSYDVPVKLYSMNLLLVAVFLLIPEMRRLSNVLLFNRPTERMKISWTPAPRWIQVARAIAKVGFIGIALFHYTQRSMNRLSEWSNLLKSPLYGIYEVEEFDKRGEATVSKDDALKRWRIVSVSSRGLSIRSLDESMQSLRMDHDAAQRTFSSSQEGKKSLLTYSQPDEAHLILDGSYRDEAIKVKLRKLDPSKFLLVNRGFHWINEVPYNK